MAGIYVTTLEAVPELVQWYPPPGKLRVLYGVFSEITEQENTT